MRKAIFYVVLSLTLPGILRAQEPTPTPAEAAAKAQALAKQTQNPVANLVTIPFQFNWNSGGGLGAQTQSILNFQPVLPLAINEKWNVVSRTIVPIVGQPLPSGERSSGIADIQEQLFFTSANPGKIIVGLGPIFSLPTATNAVLTTGQFAIGPALVVLTMPGKWVLGAVANNLWRFAGDTSTTPISAFFIQTFVNYNLKRGWALSFAPSITANWNAESGQQWTVPLGIGVAKLDMIGKQPVNVSLQYYHNIVRPDAAGSYTVRMQFALLYPKK